MTIEIKKNQQETVIEIVSVSSTQKCSLFLRQKSNNSKQKLCTEICTQLLLLEPILGISSTRDNEGKIVVDFKEVSRAVRVEGNNLVITLKQPFAPFLSIPAPDFAEICIFRYFCDFFGDTYMKNAVYA